MIYESQIWACQAANPPPGGDASSGRNGEKSDGSPSLRIRRRRATRFRSTGRRCPAIAPPGPLKRKMCFDPPAQTGSATIAIMTRKLHPNARTNLRLRREIQESADTITAQARRLGLNPKTVAKWRRRTTTSDARMGPKHPVSTVLKVAEEALIVVFRKRTRLRLDDCLAQLKPLIPALSRSALHRCLKRYGVSRIPKGRAETLPSAQPGVGSAHFTIEVCAPPGEAGGCLYVAISVTRFVFAKVMEGLNAYDAANFLAYLSMNAPNGVSSVETGDHAAFTLPDGRPWDPIYPHRTHPFRKACRDSFIGHIVTKSKSAAPTIVSKGWKDVPRRKGQGLQKTN